MYRLVQVKINDQIKYWIQVKGEGKHWHLIEQFDNLKLAEKKLLTYKEGKLHV